jgi:hypothetical protein
MGSVSVASVRRLIDTNTCQDLCGTADLVMVETKKFSTGQSDSLKTDLAKLSVSAEPHAGCMRDSVRHGHHMASHLPAGSQKDQRFEDSQGLRGSESSQPLSREWNDLKHSITLGRRPRDMNYIYVLPAEVQSIGVGRVPTPRPRKLMK